MFKTVKQYATRKCSNNFTPYFEVCSHHRTIVEREWNGNFSWRLLYCQDLHAPTLYSTRTISHCKGTTRVWRYMKVNKISWHAHQVLSDPDSWRSWRWTGRNLWTSMHPWCLSQESHTVSLACPLCHSWGDHKTCCLNSLVREFLNHSDILKRS